MASTDIPAIIRELRSAYEDPTGKPDDDAHHPGLVLDPADLVAINSAAPLISRARQIRSIVARDGEMIDGGMRQGVKVAHPLIETEMKLWANVTRILSPIRTAREGEEKGRGHNARSAALTRHWGPR
ncbi:hypothetical protein [Kitasatospora sp. McL0602]|uniref:hypothetical protein n=1 Tax=Kitasatospora sp. McL0602 TaxID=3439530 RepID=UPI003F88C554